MKPRIYIIVAISAITVLFAFVLLTNVSGFNKEVKEILKTETKFDTKKSIFLNSESNTESFEGIIELMEKQSFDTVSFRLTIKKNIVRLDKQLINGQPDESIIFDLEKESITALHHNKKMYCNIPVAVYNKNISSDYQIIKTNTTKIISGFTCSQWRVKNSVKNTEITFWVTGKKFDFYQKFIQLWNKTDNCYQYFLTIPEANGYLPIQQIERTLLRDIKYSIIVNKIVEKRIDNSQFDIPKTYTLYSN
jgi:hypothetical protein